MTTNPLRQFYIDNKFYVKVSKIDKDEDGCSANFPEILIAEKSVKKEIRTYLIIDKILEIYSSINNEIKSIDIKLHRYAIRPVIIGDIIIQSYKRSLSTDLIFPIIDGKLIVDRGGILDVVKIKLKKDEKDREKKLFPLLYKVLTGSFCDDYIQEDIENGYNHIVKLFEGGGINL